MPSLLARRLSTESRAGYGCDDSLTVFWRKSLDGSSPPESYRIRPDTVHRFVPVFKMPAGSIYMAEGKIDFASAVNPDLNGMRSCDKLAGVLHVEIEPATMTLVKVEMVKP